jgi:hypothetical protein
MRGVGQHHGAELGSAAGVAWGMVLNHCTVVRRDRVLSDESRSPSTRTMGSRIAPCYLEGFQEFHQILLLFWGESEAEDGIVMLDHIAQCRGTTVVEVRRVCRQSA